MAQPLPGTTTPGEGPTCQNWGCRACMSMDQSCADTKPGHACRPAQCAHIEPPMQCLCINGFIDHCAKANIAMRHHMNKPILPCTWGTRRGQASTHHPPILVPQRTEHQGCKCALRGSAQVAKSLQAPWPAAEPRSRVLPAARTGGRPARHPQGLLLSQLD